APRPVFGVVDRITARPGAARRRARYAGSLSGTEARARRDRGCGPAIELTQLLEQIATRTNRPDLEPERSQAPAQPEYVHIERVARGRAVGPRLARKHVARDDRAEALEQRAGERLLDR